MSTIPAELSIDREMFGDPGASDPARAIGRIDPIPYKAP
jgi:hypothetical protein